MSIGINIKQWKKYCTKYLNNTMHKKKRIKLWKNIEEKKEEQLKQKNIMRQ